MTRRVPDAAVTGSSAVESQVLVLPWLTASVSVADAGWMSQVRAATVKYARGDDSRQRAASIAVTACTDASTACARAIFEAPSVEYQFVRGCVTDDLSVFATADGSLARLAHATRHIDLALTPAVFVAPYSTWPDLFAAPLAELWRDGGCYPLHAAAVTLGTHTVLIVGSSGAGKTTTALALLQGGATWRADDKVLLATRDEAVRGVSLYRNTNVAPTTIGAFSSLGFAHDRPPLDETNDKRACMLDEVTTAVDLRPFTPTAVLFPAQTGALQTRMVRIDETTALLRLAGQSPMSPVRRRARAQHEMLCRVASTLPAYALEAGTDVLTAPADVAGRVFDDLGRHL